MSWPFFRHFCSHSDKEAFGSNLCAIWARELAKNAVLVSNLHPNASHSQLVSAAFNTKSQQESKCSSSSHIYFDENNPPDDLKDGIFSLVPPNAQQGRLTISLLKKKRQKPTFKWHNQSGTFKVIYPEVFLDKVVVDCRQKLRQVKLNYAVSFKDRRDCNFILHINA